MKQLISIISVFYTLLLSLAASAQSESSDFTSTGRGVSTPFATDYHALGISPSNLGFRPIYDDKYFTLGFAEIGVSLYSEALTKDEVRKNLFFEDIEKLSRSEQIAFAKEFANSATSLDVDIMEMGFYTLTNKLGGFAFSIRDRIDYYSKIGPKASEIMLLGFTAPYFEELVLNNGDTIPNAVDIDPAVLDQVVEGVTSLANAESLTELLQGSHLSFSWLREYNLGWGKKLLSDSTDWEIYGGIGLKLLIGQGYASVDAEDGTATTFSALSPVFDIDYSEFDSIPDFEEDAPNLKPVGMGFGVDVSGSIILDKKLVASVAVTDIGSVTWDGNVYELQDLDLTNFENPGIESVAFYDQLISLNGSDGLLQWEKSKELTTKLPTTLRVGVGLHVNEKIRVGADFIQPLNDEVGSYDKMVTAIGGDIAVLPWVRLSAGFIQGGNYDFKVPVGITFTIGQGTWEGGVASRDAITFFSEKQPTVSLSTGFLRFRF